MQTSLTKDMIKDNYLELVKCASDINKITVSSIINKAQISRQTFYYHFQDIFDLYEYVVLSDFEEIHTKCLSSVTIEEGLEYLFNFIGEKKMLINCLLRSSKRSIIDDVLYKNAKQLVSDFLNYKILETDNPSENYNFLIEFYCCAITGICSRLLADKYFNFDAKQIAKKIVYLIQSEL